MAEAAPLIATPAAPIPPGGGAEWVKAADGARLRVALFAPSGEARGTVVLSGGRTEPIEKYFEVIGELLGRGFAVLAHDWRGQGLSDRFLPDRLKGHATSYQTFLDDYAAMLDAFEARAPKPWIALGHSMGGCLALMALAAGQAPRFAAAVLSAPMLGLRTPLGKHLAGALARLFRQIGRGDGYMLRYGGKPFDAAFAGNPLTHDEARFARHRAQIDACPDLALGGVTWGWLAFAFIAMSWLERSANLAGVAIPVVIVQAQEDSIVDPASQRAAVSNLPKGRLVVAPRSRHEILMETDDRRAAFWAAFDEVAAAVA
ncbi:MAG: alpha/beta hydrolase [Phenylobacterium sp.]|uniref:alpha/beta fold hydrolase n=1 Tax=Phenylobacterium sp. TaxID=1871053 RepID=UPI0027331F52|nr:alpha/beta hydrolase [Phenylobacterium sp.]MDP3173711.1 alpha/beta hydrolase [Phenylobacterium sp.]